MEKIIIDESQFVRTISRISHEIIEKHQNLDDLIIVGIKRRGAEIAELIQRKIADLTNKMLPSIDLDITFYRDDLEKKSDMPILQDVENIYVKDQIVIIVDDVVFTGRTCRAAIDAILDIGRPKKIQFAALVDRGHREIPLRPDYVGKNVPTSLEEVVHVQLVEIDGEDRVILQ